MLGSDTVGVKEYICPSIALVGGAPEIAKPSVAACALTAAARTITLEARTRSSRSGVRLKIGVRFIGPPYLT